MPQKLNQSHTETEAPINIKEQAEKVIGIQKELILDREQAQTIKNNEKFDCELLQAINVPLEVQDLRLIKEAD